MGTRRSRPLRGALAALALGAALALAGCGGDEEDANAVPNGEAVADNPVAEAAVRTTEAGSARLFYEAQVQGGLELSEFTAEGEVDYASNRSRFVYDLSQAPIAGTERAEVRLDGLVAYVRFPDGAPQLEVPEDRGWIRVRPRPAPAEEGEEPGVAPAPRLDLSALQQDPTLFLRYLPTGASEVQEEGAEEVRGVETTIYTALLDLERVVEHGGEELGADEEQRESARRSAEELHEQLGGGIVGITTSIDGDGFIRRLLVSFDLRFGPQGELYSTLTTTDYFDFGADVDVAPPPDGDVVEATDLE